MSTSPQVLVRRIWSSDKGWDPVAMAPTSQPRTQEAYRQCRTGARETREVPLPEG